MVVTEAERLGLLALEYTLDRQRGVHPGRHAALAGAVHYAVALADRGRVTDCVHVRVGHRPQRGVGDDASALIDGQPGGGRQRRHARTARPQDHVGGDALPTRQFDRVGQHLHHLGSGTHPDAQPVERGLHVRLGLGVHGRSGLGPAQQYDVQLRVPLGDLRSRLDAGQPAAGDHHGAAAETPKPDGQQLGVLRTAQGVRVVLDTRHRGRVGHPAQPVYQRVVVQHPVVVDPHGLGVRVHRRHPAAHEPCLRALQQFRDAQLGGPLAGRRQVQTHPLGEPLLRIHHGHLYVLAPLDPGRELDRGGHARVPRPQDHHVVRGRRAGLVPCAHRSVLLASLTDAHKMGAGGLDVTWAGCDARHIPNRCRERTGLRVGEYGQGVGLGPERRVFVQTPHLMESLTTACERAERRRSRSAGPSDRNPTGRTHNRKEAIDALAGSA